VSPNKAERLEQAIHSPLCIDPPKGAKKFERTKNRLFQPATWEYTKDGFKSIIESKAARSQPKINDSKLIMPHYHERTHFKSVF